MEPDHRTSEQITNEKLHHLHAAFVKINEELETLKSTSHSMTDQSLPTPILEPKVNNPPTFSGERGKLEDYLVCCDLVFTCQSVRYVKDASKIAFAASFLRDRALSWFTSIFYKSFTTFEAFKTQLRIAFSDAEEVRRSEAKLMTLKQGTISASAHVIEFRQLAAKANLNEDNGTLLNYIFLNSLNDDIKDVMAQQERPGKILESYRIATAIDDRLYARKMEKKRALPTRDNKVYASPPPLPIVQSDAMDIDAIRTGPLSSEEKDRRFKERLCLYCGDAGHRLKECPKRGQGKVGARQ
jgi:hypothetical protein